MGLEGVEMIVSFHLFVLSFNQTHHFTFLLMIKCWSECKENHNHSCKNTVKIKKYGRSSCLFAFALLGLDFLLHFLGFLFLLPSKALSQAVLNSKGQKFQD